MSAASTPSAAGRRDKLTMKHQEPRHAPAPHAASVTSAAKSNSIGYMQSAHWMTSVPNIDMPQANATSPGFAGVNSMVTGFERQRP
jgi:hypothetical protein